MNEKDICFNGLTKRGEREKRSWTNALLLGEVSTLTLRGRCLAGFHDIKQNFLKASFVSSGLLGSPKRSLGEDTRVCAWHTLSKQGHSCQRPNQNQLYEINSKELHGNIPQVNLNTNMIEWFHYAWGSFKNLSRKMFVRNRANEISK